MTSNYENLKFAEEILSTRKECSNCWHGRTGHCALYSADCGNAVFNHKESPPWWTDYEEGEENEKKVLARKR